MDYIEHCSREIDWYMRNGAFCTERIATDAGGIKYVVGDFSWNVRGRNKPEYIEHKMAIALKKFETPISKANPTAA
jgi:hypothetical protein